jgi:hypothetical protein
MAPGSTPAEFSGAFAHLLSPALTAKAAWPDAHLSVAHPSIGLPAASAVHRNGPAPVWSGPEPWGDFPSRLAWAASETVGWGSLALHSLDGSAAPVAEASLQATLAGSVESASMADCQASTPAAPADWVSLALKEDCRVWLAGSVGSLADDSQGACRREDC